MRVIGVMDLLDGHAVHARGGARESYAPVRVVADWPIEPGDAVSLARMYLDRFGLEELYAADLDAILGRDSRHANHDLLVASIAALGVPVWLDAAVSSAAQASRVLTLGVAHVIVGLETLASFDALGEICAAIGGDRVAFSLDLRNGAPISVHSEVPQCQTPLVLAARAADAGVGHVIVIDVARVGLNAGVDLEMISGVRRAVPELTLLAGGGVRGADDLTRLAEAGCDGVLVATGLHNGGLSATDVTAARHLGIGLPPSRV
jgi:phosphoribosylformimino-5-aminoimidazole carboxamide ribotide isomerase